MSRIHSRFAMAVIMMTILTLCALLAPRSAAAGPGRDATDSRIETRVDPPEGRVPYPTESPGA